MRLLHSAARTERAPSSLQDEVLAMRARAPESRRRWIARPGLARPALGFVSIAMPAIVAAVVAVVLTLGGGAGAPSIAQAAALASRGPAASAPAPDQRAPALLLAAHVGNLHFPNWQTVTGWRAVGQREDSLGDRTVRTVYYSADGIRIAYSIVSAPALAGLDSHGEPYSTMRRSDRVAIVWVEQNHTCVLSGVGVSPQQLWVLARRA